MKQRSLLRAAAIAVVAVISLTAAACAPQAPGGGIAPVNWSFRGTSVTVNNSPGRGLLLRVRELRGRAVPVAGGLPGEDRSAGLRRRLGREGQPRRRTFPSGPARTFSGNQNAQVMFNGVQPLDVVNALNPSNKLEVVGTYTWAAEEDTFDTLSGAANDTASILENTLNSTLAMSTLPTTPAPSSTSSSTTSVTPSPCSCRTSFRRSGWRRHARRRPLHRHRGDRHARVPHRHRARHHEPPARSTPR